MNHPRLNYAALTFSLAAHASLLLAWQVPVTPPAADAGYPHAQVNLGLLLDEQEKARKKPDAKR